MASATNQRTPDRSWDDTALMVPVEEALDRVLAAVCPLPALSLPLLDALGLVAAEAVRAREDVPPFTNSAMDGFAVRAADTASAAAGRPVSLLIAGAIAAGDAARGEVKTGEAIRIMTGAPLPAGADAVVRFEETTDAPPDRVCVHQAVTAHENVRFAGEDLRASDPVVPAGAVVSAPLTGMLAALGETAVAVHRRPRVAILSTGNELLMAGEATGDGRIRDSNSTTLAALVLEAGGLPLALGSARDEMDALRGALRRAVREFAPDLILTSGGVSVGDYDMVKEALQAEGQIAIWQVRMKPGKPLAFGSVAGVPLLGLPGNPVAAAVSFLEFGYPAIRRMLGHAGTSLPTVPARTAEAIVNRGRRRHFVRVRLARDDDGRFVATPAGEQGAGILSSLARADGLLVLPEDRPEIPAGARLPVQLLHGRLSERHVDALVWTDRVTQESDGRGEGDQLR